MNQQLKRYYIFLAGSICVSLGLQFLLPFPYGFIVALVICILLPYGIRYMYTRKMKNGAGRFGGVEMGSKITKICMACGKQSNGKICPRCGSKAFKYS